jgi:hypothetical protein
MRATRRCCGLLGAALAALGLVCDRPAPPGTSGSTGPTAQSLPAEDSNDPSARAAQAIANALEERDAFARAGKLAELLPTLGPEALPEVQRRLARSVLLRAPEFELLLRFWAASDPAAASKWSFSLAPRYKPAAIQISVEHWAEVDPAAAQAWVDALEPKEYGVTAVEAARLALVRGWFRVDRAALEAHIRSLEATGAREQMVFTYALSLLEADGKDALVRWAEGIPEQEEGYKRSVYFQTTVVLAAFEPDTAISWCDRHCEGPYAVGMRQIIASTRLNNGDPGGSVLEWVANAPATETNRETLVAAYGIFARRDRDGALVWMQQQLSDPTSAPWIGRLYAPYALHLASSAPAEAIALAERVEPDAQRDALLVEIARAWRAQDEAAADAWLAHSPLPESSRALVREPDPAAALPAPAP